MTKKQVEEEEFIWLTLQHCCSSLKEVRTETQAGQDLGGRSKCKGHGRELLTGLLLMACSAHLLIESRTSSTGMAPPNVGWPSPIGH